MTLATGAAKLLVATLLLNGAAAMDDNDDDGRSVTCMTQASLPSINPATSSVLGDAWSAAQAAATARPPSPRASGAGREDTDEKYHNDAGAAGAPRLPQVFRNRARAAEAARSPPGSPRANNHPDRTDYLTCTGLDNQDVQAIDHMGLHLLGPLEQKQIRLVHRLVLLPFLRGLRN